MASLSDFDGSCRPLQHIAILISKRRIPKSAYPTRELQVSVYEGSPSKKRKLNYDEGSPQSMVCELQIPQIRPWDSSAAAHTTRVLRNRKPAPITRIKVIS